VVTVVSFSRNRRSPTGAAKRDNHGRPCACVRVSDWRPDQSASNQPTRPQRNLKLPLRKRNWDSTDNRVRNCSRNVGCGLVKVFKRIARAELVYVTYGAIHSYPLAFSNYRRNLAAKRSNIPSLFPPQILNDAYISHLPIIKDPEIIYKGQTGK
jgi:hypothetical protein